MFQTSFYASSSKSDAVKRLDCKKKCSVRKLEEADKIYNHSNSPRGLSKGGAKAHRPNERD